MSDKDLQDLRNVALAAFDAGFERLCITHREGFNGEICPKCWPPSYERAFANVGMTVGLTAVDFYGWLSSQIGATRTDADAARWMAVRDALGIAVLNHGKG